MKTVNCPKCRQRFSLDRTEQPSAFSEELHDLDEVVDHPPEAAVPPTDSATAVEAPPPEPVDVTCPQCGYEQEIPGETLAGKAVNVTCQHCQHLFIHRIRPSWARRRVAPLPDHPGFNPEAAALARSARPHREQLPGVGELLSRSGVLFRQQLGTLLGVLLLSLIPAGVVSLFLSAGIRLVVGMLGEGGIAMTIIGVLLLLSGLLVFSLITTASVFAMEDDQLGALKAFLLGLQKTLSAYRVSLLLCFVLLGGYLLFFPLGVVLTCWFGTALFVHIAEDECGMEALLKSREYARGQTLEIFAHLLLFFVAALFLAVLWLLIPLLAGLLTILTGLYALIYSYQLYSDLREVKPEISFACSVGARWKFLVLSAVGYLVSVGLVLVLIGPDPFSGLTISKLRVMLFPHQATLSLQQTVYAPGEVIEVYFTTTPDVPDDGWIGIVPSHIAHGDEVANEQHGLAYQHLERRRQGGMLFRAPMKPGDYDLRLHDTDVNGRELVSVSFTVDAKKKR
jgi:hypothetical protein